MTHEVEEENSAVWAVASLYIPVVQYICTSKYKYIFIAVQVYVFKFR